MKKLIALILVIIMTACATTGPIKDHHYYLRFLTFVEGWLLGITATEVGIGNTPEIAQVRRYIYDQCEHWLEYSKNTNWKERHDEIYSCLWMLLVNYKDQMRAEFYQYFAKRLATWQ